MQRLIDAEPFYDKLEEYYRSSCGETHEILRNLLNVLCDMPTVDAAPVKHGKWIPNEIHGHKIKVINGIPNGSCICDVCGQWLVGSNEYDVYGNYCPACGAKMDLEEQDDTTGV